MSLPPHGQVSDHLQVPLRQQKQPAWAKEAGQQGGNGINTYYHLQTPVYNRLSGVAMPKKS